MELTDRPMTSEEKLLRLIRKKNTASRAGMPVGPAAGEGTPASPSWTTMAGASPSENGTENPRKVNRARGIWKNRGGEEDGNTGVDFWAVSNRILTVVVCGIFLFIVWRYSFQGQTDTGVLPAVGGREDGEPEANHEGTIETTGLPVARRQTGAQAGPVASSTRLEGWESRDLARPMDMPVLRPFDFYHEEIKRRDLFQNPWQAPGSAAPSSSGSAVELSKQLKLVGILLDDDPRAIIEDAATKQTFFVSTGERIGEAVVEEIRGDRVILVFHEAKVELVP